mmetsp:Transcript_26148/g.77381  ORF Transcript_26148/g.77381 Transcript_26148/m.77381 type:complete len:168 (-) Transcript_26148:182-685(-)
MDGCISLEYDYRHNIYRLFEYEDFEIRDISGDEPSAPPTIRIPPTMDVTREITWKEEIYKHVKRKGAIARGANKAFGLVWGQCTPVVQSKLRSLGQCMATNAAYDNQAFLQLVQGGTFKFDNQKCPYHALCEAEKNFFAFPQGKKMMNDKYCDRFKNNSTVVNKFGG